MELLFTWLVCVVVFFIVDFIWLGFIAKSFYRSQINLLLAGTFNGIAAISFYLIYVIGIMWFCLHDATDWYTAALNGALFGFFCYATYDMTNYATLKGWPFKVAIIDIAWGTFLTSFTAGVTEYVSSKFLL